MENESIALFTDLITLAAKRECLRLLVLSRPFEKGLDTPQKIIGRLSIKRGKKILFLENQFAGGRVSQAALAEQELSESLPPLLLAYRQCDLITPLGDASLLTSKHGKHTLRGERHLRALIGGADTLPSTVTPLEREANRILSGREPFLAALGIANADGRVHDKRQGKFRQINRFLEYAEDIYPRLPASGTLTVYDLCCGKSYLSFALYHYLTEIKGRCVSMLGMDIKEDVMRDCRAIAANCGFLAASSEEGAVGMRFLAGDIRALPASVSPDLVVSLHACDIATDLVLANAVRLGARVILSTPCCHRELATKLRASALTPILREPKLRAKLAEAATDALRCLYLGASGYEAHTAELVDPDDTPKNTLIRAYRVPLSERTLQKRGEEFESMLAFLLGDGAEDYLAATTGVPHAPTKGA